MPNPFLFALTDSEETDESQSTGTQQLESLLEEDRCTRTQVRLTLYTGPDFSPSSKSFTQIIEALPLAYQEARRRMQECIFKKLELGEKKVPEEEEREEGEEREKYIDSDRSLQLVLERTLVCYRSLAGIASHSNAEGIILTDLFNLYGQPATERLSSRLLEEGVLTDIRDEVIAYREALYACFNSSQPFALRIDSLFDAYVTDAGNRFYLSGQPVILTSLVGFLYAEEPTIPSLHTIAYIKDRRSKLFEYFSYHLPLHHGYRLDCYTLPSIYSSSPFPYSTKAITASVTLADDLSGLVLTGLLFPFQFHNLLKSLQNVHDRSTFRLDTISKAIGTELFNLPDPATPFATGSVDVLTPILVSPEGITSSLPHGKKNDVSKP
ncbi:hypothetical protein GMRT_12372 [Giardia muris]|uniref:Uncharacterized protein n=1 Tax=Giardia muris TaxID=5742 RepID=A0A4Z1T4C3_GIAMU|nr:hypothetical protein GMRT_12372 [Giardia muris]|eukprot:TNJ27271.1 hypothetical protein GMRT_12372 [Giardia muris]